MKVNADFTRRAVVHGAALPWVPSPIPSVERKMLDRVGDEVARATSIVRYAPRSHFSRHIHGGGEEFLVLEGVFQDEHGTFPVGTYVRNPPTSSHTPFSDPGCVILVKLWQFHPDDRTQVRVDSAGAAFAPDPARPGVSVLPLFADAREDVRLERWAAGAEVCLPAGQGLEVFVVEGSFREGGDEFRRHSWLRLPPGAQLSAEAGGDAVLAWVKALKVSSFPISEAELQFAAAK